jgi:hypothetical protein
MQPSEKAAASSSSASLTGASNSSMANVIGTGALADASVAAGIDADMDVSNLSPLQLSRLRAKGASAAAAAAATTVPKEQAVLQKIVIELNGQLTAAQQKLRLSENANAALREQLHSEAKQSMRSNDGGGGGKK